jgi:hypothetical protein
VDFAQVAQEGGLGGSRRLGCVGQNQRLGEVLDLSAQASGLHVEAGDFGQALEGLRLRAGQFETLVGGGQGSSEAARLEGGQRVVPPGQQVLGLQSDLHAKLLHGLGDSASQEKRLAQGCAESRAGGQ